MRTLDWEAKEEKARSMTVTELLYSIKDCRDAEKASKGRNPENEGYYADEASVYTRELNRRRVAQ